jgi:hypothetical protein
MSKSEKEFQGSVYRSPATGFELSTVIVPEISTWWCRKFGHKYSCLYFKKKWSSDAYETIPTVGPFPLKNVPPSMCKLIWCVRCSREWKNENFTNSMYGGDTT